MNPSQLQLDPLSAQQSLALPGCWLIDVREAHEVARAGFDLPNVIHLPLSELQQRHAELPRNADLILACAAGGRSMQALQFLLHQGHTKVRNLAGGIGAWNSHGLPVRRS
ncbi:rhodanese-like domain-containing protein [Roseateles sp.]|uniref:rhodanese-like domain-containing protein n=1 Tax=Roseateles sp. TaxID=1971397 RepID=UPI00286B8054|nr:rhodanese-like domain-containing protein [Roseateles sp.]